MTDNRDLVRKAGEFLNTHILGKAEGGSLNLSTTHYNQLIPRETVETMIDVTRDHSAFLSAVNVITRSSKKGTIPIWDLEGIVMEHVGEQDPSQVTSQLTLSQVPFVTEKFKCDIVISHEEAAEHAAAGLGNFETKAVNSFNRQLGNNIAELSFRGDKTAGVATREARMLKGIDGVDVLTDAGANVTNWAGKAFARGVYGSMYDAIPWKYRRDPGNLRWWQTTRVSNHYRDALSNITTGVGDQAITQREIPAAMGIDSWIVPYISDTDGPTAIAPTSVSGTTNVTAVLTTLVTAGDPTTAALGSGRKFLITCTATGQSEVCTGFVDTTLQISTVGKLGQTTVSTTASDYTVRPYDETAIYLGDPKSISIVWNNGWRSSREYNKDLDQIEITIYMELCVLMPILDGIVKYTGISVPPLTW